MHRQWRSEGQGKSFIYAEFEDRKKSELKAWLMQHQDIVLLVKLWRRFERWTFSLSTRMQTLVFGSLVLAITGLLIGLFKFLSLGYVFS